MTARPPTVLSNSFPPQPHSHLEPDVLNREPLGSTLFQPNTCLSVRSLLDLLARACVFVPASNEKEVTRCRRTGRKKVRIGE